MGDIVLKICGFAPNLRFSEMSLSDLEYLLHVFTNLSSYRYPEWLMNSRKHKTTGKSLHIISEKEFSRDGFLKGEPRTTRCIRLEASLRVRGQHTKSTGRNSMTSSGTPLYN